MLSLYVASTRSGKPYAQNLLEELHKNPLIINDSPVRITSLESIVTVPFADSSLRIRKGSTELPNDLKNSHVILVSPTNNPHNKGPFMPDIKERLEEILLQNHLNEEILNDFLKQTFGDTGLFTTYSYDYESGEIKGSLKNELKKIVHSYKESIKLIQKVTLNIKKQLPVQESFMSQCREVISNSILTRDISTELMETLLTLEILKNKYGYQNITGFFPWPEGGRSDSDYAKNSELNLSKIYASLIEPYLKSFITIGMHSDEKTKFDDSGKELGLYGQMYHFKKAFKKKPILDLDANELFIDYIIDNYRTNSQDLVFVGPDEGSANLTIDFFNKVKERAEELEIYWKANYIIMEKYRPDAQKVKRMDFSKKDFDINGQKYKSHSFGENITYGNLKNKLKNKLFIYRDDMIDTGGTFEKFLQKAYRDFEYRGIVAIIDHLPMSFPGAQKLENAHKFKELVGSGLHDVVTLDTVPWKGYNPEWLTVLSSSKLAANGIKAQLTQMYNN